MSIFIIYNLRVIKVKILFYISKAYSIPIIEPLVKQCNRDEIKFALYVSKKVKAALPEYWKKLEIFSFLGEAISYNPDFVLVPGNFVDYRIPGIKVEIFHGLGVEKAAHYKIRHLFDVYLTSGPFVTEKYNQLQQKHKYFYVKETGWPKVDHILNFPKQNIRKSLNLPEDKKIVLFAPTHSSKMQSATALMPIIPQIIQTDEIWLVKFHELMSKEISEKFSQQNANIIQINSADITPYLHAADLLISDTSSVIYEFMTLDKPIITYNTTGRVDKGINISEPTELRAAIDQSWQNPTEFSANRKDHLSQINPYLNGEICQNVLATLAEIKQNDLIPKKRKPLNLFRKAQLHYHEKFKKGYLR